MANVSSKVLRKRGAVPCVTADAPGITFALFPPTAFSIDISAAVYKLMLPYAVAVTDFAVAEGPRLRQRLRPGDLVAAEPGSRLSARYVEPLEFLLVTVAPQRVRTVAEASGRTTWRLHNSLPWHDSAVAALGQELRRVLIGEGLAHPAYLAALADALVARTVEEAARKVTRSKREAIAPAALARVVHHIESALEQPIEVADLAAVAGLSTAHFARGFALATGDPPHRFVMKRRVCRARDLLSATDVSVAQIAVSTGFANQAHMSKAFAREVGLSPAKYRAAFAGKKASASVRLSPST